MKRNRTKVWEFLREEEFSEPIKSGNPITITVYGYFHADHDTARNIIPVQLQDFNLYPIGDVTFNSGIDHVDNIEDTIYRLCNYRYEGMYLKKEDAYIEPTVYATGRVGSGMMFEFDGLCVVCKPFGWGYADSLEAAINILKEDSLWNENRFVEYHSNDIQRAYGYNPYKGLEYMQEDMLFWYNMEVKKAPEISYASFFNFWWELYNK